MRTNDSIHSADVADEYGRRIFFEHDAAQWRAWPAQANHIFNHLNITSNFEDYVSVESILCWLELSGTAYSSGISAGYLFLCPSSDFQSDTPSDSGFRLPSCAAYWSLDPSGTDRLSAEAAHDLGFPTLRFKMEGRGEVLGGWSLRRNPPIPRRQGLRPVQPGCRPKC
ncbi:hypothetical protein B0H14DRAFT_2616249 [Mycena olivaceomarginata]|nr:hypothetical protein B0H14DRAFT_2616249 [Mycena olivaceomarginata]